MKYSRRGSRPVSMVVIHTTEGARSAESLREFFNSGVNASSHAAVDATGIHEDGFVPYEHAAWTLRAGNPVSDNLEVCAFARWDRPQWLSTRTVDGCPNPRAMVRWTGRWIGQRCKERNIPLRRMTYAEIRDAVDGNGRHPSQGGVVMHWDYTRATGDGTHWDVGSGFPWDVAFTYAQEVINGGDDVALNEQDLKKIYDTVWFGVPGAKLINDRLSGESSAWPGDFLGSVSERTTRQVREDAAKRTTPIQVDVTPEVISAIAREVADLLANRLAE